MRACVSHLCACVSHLCACVRACVQGVSDLKHLSVGVPAYLTKTQSLPLHFRSPARRAQGPVRLPVHAASV